MGGDPCCAQREVRVACTRAGADDGERDPALSVPVCRLPRWTTARADALGTLVLLGF